MSDRVLVTGITGFVGGHVALDLLKRGYTVRGSLRSMKKADHVRDTLARHGAPVDKLEFIELDLLSDKGWDEAVKDCRYVQHIASPFVTSMPDDEMELIRPAVEGTERALNAAFKADVERVIVTSSAAAVMYGHARDRKAPFTANDWTNIEGRDVTAYVKSKALAERRAWEIAEAAGRTNDIATVNPTGIFGPLLDTDPGTSGAIIVDVLKGQYPAVPRFAMGIVDVRDVAAVHVAAMENAEAGGHRYPVSAETIWMKRMAETLATAFPQYRGKLPKFTLPDWAVKLYANFNADIKGILGELGTFKVVDSSDAEALINRKLIPADEAVIATAKTIIDQGLLSEEKKAA